MGRFLYQVVRRHQGWAFRLGETYSRTFPSQFEATAAAKTSAISMHEHGDETLVGVQDGPLAWRTELVIKGTHQLAPEETVLEQKVGMGG